MTSTTFSWEYQFVPMHNLIDSLWSMLTASAGMEMWLKGKWEINVALKIHVVKGPCGCCVIFFVWNEVIVSISVSQNNQSVRGGCLFGSCLHQNGFSWIYINRMKWYNNNNIKVSPVCRSVTGYRVVCGLVQENISVCVQTLLHHLFGCSKKMHINNNCMKSFKYLTTAASIFV